MDSPGRISPSRLRSSRATMIDFRAAKRRGMTMAAFTDLFDRIVCINLDRRPDRWESFSQRLAPAGIPADRVMRFAAIDGTILPPPPWWKAGRGAWGCHQSHVRVLEDALQDRVQSL